MLAEEREVGLGQPAERHRRRSAEVHVAVVALVRGVRPRPHPEPLRGRARLPHPLVVPHRSQREEVEPAADMHDRHAERGVVAGEPQRLPVRVAAVVLQPLGPPGRDFRGGETRQRRRRAVAQRRQRLGHRLRERLRVLRRDLAVAAQQLGGGQPHAPGAAEAELERPAVVRPVVEVVAGGDDRDRAAQRGRTLPRRQQRRRPVVGEAEDADRAVAEGLRGHPLDRVAAVPALVAEGVETRPPRRSVRAHRRRARRSPPRRA